MLRQSLTNSPSLPREVEVERQRRTVNRVSLTSSFPPIDFYSDFPLSLSVTI